MKLIYVTSFDFFCSADDIQKNLTRVLHMTSYNMFTDEVSSEEDNYREYDGYIGSSEIKKMRKKANRKVKAANNEEEDGDEEIVDESVEIIDDDDGKKEEKVDEAEDDIEIGIKSNIFARYPKEIVILPPEEHMSIDKLSKYEYSRLVSVETKRIEVEDNPFVTTDGLTYADHIAEKTVNMNREPYLIERSVGFSVDYNRRVVIEYKELIDPKKCRKGKLNATSML